MSSPGGFLSAMSARRRRRPRTIHDYFRGHLLVLEGSDDYRDYRYADDLTLVLDHNGVERERPCVRCGVPAERGGPDPCLGVLPGVYAACCGHGVDEDEPYVAFRWRPTDGDVLRGEDALAYFRQCGVGPPAGA